MDFSQLEPAAIWRMLIPSARWLFAGQLPDDELIFTYRDRVYFVNSDGSVIAMPKPPHLDRMDLADLLDRLALADDTVDYDDMGIFDCGSILKDMGYVVPVRRGEEKGQYLIEIVNTIAPQTMVTRYELKRVSFPFALYHALMRCRELNAKSDGEFEHEVKRIELLEAFPVGTQSVGGEHLQLSKRGEMRYD